MRRLVLAWFAGAGLLVAGQYRAFWADAFHAGYQSPADIDRLVDDLVQAKANAIFMEVRRRGDSYYLRSLEPPILPNFDALDYLIERAHERGIEVHAWFPVTPLWTGSTPPADPRHAWLQHGPAAPGDQMWMTVSAAGSVSPSYVDPGHPAAARYLADVVVHVVENYAIDGVHLDYIRYPEAADYGYNPVAMDRFQRLASGAYPTFSDFRRAQVTELVRQIYLRALALKPQLKVSAALITWGDGPRSDAEFRAKDAYSRVFQDWRAWLEEGILDLGLPMNYFREAVNAPFFDRWGEYEKTRQYGRGIVVGTAPYLNSIADSVRQTERALAGNRALGICYYSYASTNSTSAPNDEFYRAIGEFFGPPERPAELEWKTRPTRGHVMGRLEVSGGAGWLADGATVRLVDEASGAESISATDSGGFFGFVDRPPGLYHLRLERAGQTLYRSIQRPVTAGAVTSFEVRLRADDFDAVLPRFPVEGIVNAASFQPGPQSAGALVSLFGRNLAPRSEAAARLSLPTELGGVQVLVLGRAVPLLYVSPGQINFQLPSFLALLLRPGNQYPLVVRHSGLDSEPRNLTLGRSVGIFTVVHAAGFQPVTAANPAGAGEYLAVYATGLGPTAPPLEDGQPGASQEPLHRTVAATLLTLGNRLLAVSYSGLAPGLVGVYQVNFQVPPDFPAGRAGLVLLVGGTASPPVQVDVR